MWKQSRTQSPLAFWSADGRQKRLWDNGKRYFFGLVVWITMEVRQEVRLSIVNANRKQRNQLPCFGGRFEMSTSSFVNIVCFNFIFPIAFKPELKQLHFKRRVLNYVQRFLSE